MRSGLFSVLFLFFHEGRQVAFAENFQRFVPDGEERSPDCAILFVNTFLARFIKIERHTGKQGDRAVG